MNTSTRIGTGILEWIFATTWQAAVVVGLILLAQWVFRKRLSPAGRYGLWLLLVIRLLMPSSPQTAFSIFNIARLQHQPGPVYQSIQASKPDRTSAARPTEMSQSIAPMAADPAAVSENEMSGVAGGSANRVASPWPAMREQRSSAWIEGAFWIWLLGVAVLGWHFLWTNLRFHSCIRGHVPVSNANVTRLLNECRDTLRMRQRVTLIETEEVTTPAVYGLWHKRVLLPDGSFERFSREELRYILLHELVHLKRRDLEIHCLVSALQVLHWFKPVLLWVAENPSQPKKQSSD